MGWYPLLVLRTCFSIVMKNLYMDSFQFYLVDIISAKHCLLNTKNFIQILNSYLKPEFHEKALQFTSIFFFTCDTFRHTLFLCYQDNFIFLCLRISNIHVLICTYSQIINLQENILVLVEFAGTNPLPIQIAYHHIWKRDIFL